MSNIPLERLLLRYLCLRYAGMWLTVKSCTEEHISEERPGWIFLFAGNTSDAGEAKKPADAASFQIFEEHCWARNLKIRRSLESGHRSHSLHCFHARRLNCRQEHKSAAIDKRKNDTRMRCWTPCSWTPSNTVLHAL